MPIPGPLFWENENKLMAKALLDTMFEVYLSGADNGLGQLPAGFTQMIDWDAFNEMAIRWIRQYEGGLIRRISETTQKQVNQVISKFIESGQPLKVLTKDIAAIQNELGQTVFNFRRAKMIAATETTRAYAEGNQQAWQDTSSVTGKRWNTSVDELVCPICGPQNKKVVPLNEAGFTGLKSQPISGPPAHPNCRCWLTPVVDIEKAKEQITMAVYE